MGWAMLPDDNDVPVAATGCPRAFSGRRELVRMLCWDVSFGCVERSHLKNSSVFILPFDEEFDGDLFGICMGDAFTGSDICIRVIADFTVAVDGFQFQIDKPGSNQLFKHMHDFRAHTSRQRGWQYSHLEEPFVLVLPFDEEFEGNLSGIGVGDAFAVPDTSVNVEAVFTVAIDGLQFHTGKLTSDHLFKQLHHLRADA